MPAVAWGHELPFRLRGAGKDFQEYQIPTHQLRHFNNALIGPSEVVAEFGS
jgi:hypothetical protein